MTQITRRDLLKAGACVTAGAAALSLCPPPLLAHMGGARPVPVPPIQDPDVKKLALRAMEASRAAGATYADVRLTHTWKRSFETFPHVDITDEEGMRVGVRAWVNGYWGFASGPVWTPDEMGRLGREAVVQAKANSLGKSRPSELAPVPPVKDGHWVTPVRIDPFQVSPLEVVDMLESMNLHGKLLCERVFTPPKTPTIVNACEFWMQDKAFASTEGSFCTQRLYRSQGTYVIALIFGREKDYLESLGMLAPAAVGWELYRDQAVREGIRQMVEEIDADRRLDKVPIDVGRYDVAMDGDSVAWLLSRTLGRATELDRALGYEANASGTSYLNDPLDMLGRYQAGAALLTVTSNRSKSGGCATVQWDDEGVVPDEITLVKDGVLTDFQTTREGASVLQPYYAKQQQPVRSHGCARATDGVSAPLVFRSNLALQPGRETLGFEDMVGTLKDGLALKRLRVGMDFQCLNGRQSRNQFGEGGKWYLINNGRRVAMGKGTLRFRSPELWKSLIAVGGADSARQYGIGGDALIKTFDRLANPSKGEPPQPEAEFHSVTAPPVMFKQLAVAG